MSFGGDPSVGAKSSKRTDTKQIKVDKDDIPKMKDNLRALEKISAEAQREAAKIRQHLDDVEESADSPVINSPFAKLDPEFARRAFAKNIIQADRGYISQAFHYLDDVLCARYTDALLDEYRDGVKKYSGVQETAIPRETPDSEGTQENVPGENVPGENVPEENVPGENVPEENVPEKKTSWWW